MKLFNKDDYKTLNFGNTRKLQLAVFSLVFGIAGVAYLLMSHAATQTSTLTSSSSNYVSQASPTAINFKPTYLYTRGGSGGTASDARHSYVKFVVSGTTTPTNAKLRIYTQTASPNGFTVKQVSGNYNGTLLTYTSPAPTVLGVVKSFKPTLANSWAVIDVSAIVTKTGTFAFALWPNDATLITYSNSGATAPQLLYDTQTAGDTTAPTNVGIVTPKASETVSGTYDLQSSASDNVGVTKVDFFIDGTNTGTGSIGSAGNYTLSVDTTKLSDGQHTVYSKAYDAAGNSTQSGSVNFSVANAAPSTGSIKATFYYPWFPETWGSNLSNPFTVFHPTAGFYTSDDSAVVTKHLNQMTYAGFDAAIASWWGPSTHSEQTRIPNLLNNAANSSNGKKLKWALYYEKESVGDPSAAELTTDLSYIKSKYTSSPQYLKIGGKPVIFVFTSGSDTCTSMAQRWHDVNANEGFFVVLKTFSNYTTCQYQPEGWHQYGPAQAVDTQGKYSYTISPGFWKKGEATARLPRLSQTDWAANIDAMLASDAQFKLVTTFDEWGEGSAVEPATEWASASGYGQYIDTLHQKFNNTTTTDTTPPTTPSNLSATAVSSTQINLTWSASTDPDSAVGGYLVYRNGTQVADTHSTGTSYSDSGLTSNTGYSYTVAAYDSANASLKSSQTAAVQVTTLPDVQQPSDTTPPSVPANVKATLSSSTSSTVNVSWSASTDNAGGSGLKLYLIVRTDANNNKTNFTIPAGTTTLTDGSANYSTTYKYVVTAQDIALNLSAPSTAATVTTPTPVVPDTAAPDVPVVKATVVSTSQVTISWAAVADNPKTGGASGVKGYLVFRNGTQIASVTTTSVSDSGFSFASNQTYNYTVLAYDVAGNKSAQSAAASVIPNPVIASGGRCGNTSTGSKIDTVVVIAEENESWSLVGGVGFGATGTNSMPYSHAVASECTVFSSMTETELNPQNSATQYVGAWTGFGSSVTHVKSDCSPSATCSYTGNNIFRVLRNAGIPHKEYIEGATANCATGSNNPAKHIPDLYMYDATDKANCASEVVPLTQFSFANPPAGLSFITPNLTNDGHDSAPPIADNWLANSNRLPALFNSAAYKSGRVLLVLWWDEDKPKPNLFACSTCKHQVASSDPTYAGDVRLWLNLLGSPTTNLGAISNASDIRSLIGTP